MGSQVLLSGLEDWVSLAEAATLMRRTAPTADPDAIKRATLEVLGELLGAGLLEAGELAPGFAPRRDASADVLREIDQDWTVPDTELRPWDRWWFADTEAGDEVARSLPTG